MIPYIQTDADRASIRQRQFLLVLGTITLLAGALALVHYQIQPLDELYLQVREQVGFETTAHEATEPKETSSESFPFLLR
jgi:CHASE3 domain sensor protein